MLSHMYILKIIQWIVMTNGHLTHNIINLKLTNMK